MAYRTEMFRPTRGFSEMADSMEPCKMLWGRPLLPCNEIWARRLPACIHFKLFYVFVFNLLAYVACSCGRVVETGFMTGRSISRYSSWWTCAQSSCLDVLTDTQFMNTVCRLRDCITVNSRRCVILFQFRIYCRQPPFWSYNLVFITTATLNTCVKHLISSWLRSVLRKRITNVSLLKTCQIIFKISS